MLYLSVSSAQSPSSAQTHADLTSFNNWERSCAFAGVNLDARVLPRTFKDTGFWSSSSYGLLQVHLLGHDGGDGSWVTCMMSLRASTGQESSTQQTSRQGVLSPVVGAQPSFHSSHIPFLLLPLVWTRAHRWPTSPLSHTQQGFRGSSIFLPWRKQPPPVWRLPGSIRLRLSQPWSQLKRGGAFLCRVIEVWPASALLPH